MITKIVVCVVVLVSMSGSVYAAANCTDVPTAGALKNALIAAVTLVDPVIAVGGGSAGGLFGGARMWGATVNRDGEICSYSTSTVDPSQVWPGSQAIAKAKAYTANAFSLDATVAGLPAGFPLSTAQLYTFTQPGRSLWSLGQSNLFNPSALTSPGGQGGNNQIAGGLIFFGGGVALYKNGVIIGALGISGDTSCADHEIAKRVRHILGLDPTAGPTVDDISYTVPDGASAFTHPKCINTYRNGVLLPGSEQPAVGY
jgi:uncharacterized protein GlcG (DUF336 family)